MPVCEGNCAQCGCHAVLGALGQHCGARCAALAATAKEQRLAKVRKRNRRRAATRRAARVRALRPRTWDEELWGLVVALGCAVAILEAIARTGYTL